ncbi:hypothetical protein P3X46_005738 [Hevea brasiliensis]|uniref:DUF4378 domain-containing protein n=1 Tax=Hevea brasiliensis TaxID=3981 RepID=A0ABQ9N233_HEVBR|nr:uncharacterized protein LOC110663305 isoform X2 [Hevea brasiliensis]KAJ9186209.1 hypothetical protein P3X46_005738 [Hevea brasiliensis]
MISAPAVDSEKFTCELGWRSLKQAAGTPMKKLLAEEMSREAESKTRSPSVIARLMGFDGLPAQQLSHKQHKKSSENYLQRIAPTEKSQRSSASCSRSSSRKGSKEEQEFKDVFEVLDASKRESRYLLQGTANSKLTEAEMTFIKQKFMDVTCLSSDEKLNDLKEFQDAIDDLDSNKDLLLKFLEQPDSLFAKHLHDLQAALPQSHCRRISGMKSSHAPEHEGGGLGCKVERKMPWKNHRKHQSNPLSHSYRKQAADNPLKASKLQLEGKEQPSVLPTRIVVLKPNFGKVHNATKIVSSTRSSHDFLSDCKRHTELPSIKNREADLFGNEKFPDQVALPRYKSRESREIAKEITRQMKNSLGSGSIKFSTLGFRGYAGDESSSNRSDNESANDSDVQTVISRSSIGWSNQYRSSSSRSSESSVSREAKKRLSERWKMTHSHRYVDMGVVGRGSTLGEMLALPGKERRPANVDAMIVGQGFIHNFDGNDEPAGSVEPLGISSRDGWKDGCIRNLSRSRSVPASCTTIGSPKTGMRYESLCNDQHILPKELMQQESVKAVKGKPNQRESSSSRNSRSRLKRSHLSEYTCTDHSDTSPEINVSHKQVQSSITDDDQFKPCHMVSKTSASIVTDMSFIPENVLDVAIENVAMPSKNTDSELPAYMLVKGNSSSSDPEALISQEPLNGPPDESSAPVQHSVAELQSPASSKEAEQPSPVSVLETPFPDDLSSSSECFESLSADLHGLRMQLQLLKLESEAYAEGPIHISSDEDVEDGYVGFSEEKGIVEESRERSYVVDVLLESGINSADPDSFLASWHCPECPLNPLVFEGLEKKHCNLTSWPRSERKLLFDRINSSLLMINQQFADPYLWVRPATAIIPRWIKHGLEDGIHKLLASQEKKANNNAVEKVLVMDSQWLDLRGEIDVVGREIERLMIEELVKEIEAVLV